MLAAIVESTDDAIISTRLDGTVMTWNQGARRLFGYEEDQIVGRAISSLIPDGPARGRGKGDRSADSAWTVAGPFRDGAIVQGGGGSSTCR